MGVLSSKGNDGPPRALTHADYLAEGKRWETEFKKLNAQQLLSPRNKFSNPKLPDKKFFPISGVRKSKPLYNDSRVCASGYSHSNFNLKKKKKKTLLDSRSLKICLFSFFIRYVLPCVHAAPIAAVSDYDIAKDTLGDPAHMLQWLVRCVLESIDPKSRGKTTKAGGGGDQDAAFLRGEGAFRKIAVECAERRGDRCHRPPLPVRRHAC
jgi:hypothetical protein